jgi:hypothetical protein
MSIRHRFGLIRIWRVLHHLEKEILEGRHKGRDDTAEAVPTPLWVVQISQIARYRVPGQWQSRSEAWGGKRSGGAMNGIYSVRLLVGIAY